MQIWTAADFSFNETVSGVSITSYNNARCHTLSLNGIKTVANTQVRINQENMTPRTILSSKTWLDTSQDLTSTSNNYSGVQFFAKMPGITATEYLPQLQLIFEYDVEFKQPAYQNRPSSFETDFIGSTLTVIPDPLLPLDTREYYVDRYTLSSAGNRVSLLRSDGVAGSLIYTQAEFWDVYVNRTSGQYFGNRPADYSGPEPRKPLI